jgi:hypothetical protein
MAQEEEENPHVGGTSGASSQAASRDAGTPENADAGAGNIEIPIGMPVSDEEFRRLKEEARRPVRGGEEDAEDAAQEDPGTQNGS